MVIFHCRVRFTLEGKLTKSCRTEGSGSQVLKSYFVPGCDQHILSQEIKIQPLLRRKPAKRYMFFEYILYISPKARAVYYSAHDCLDVVAQEFVFLFSILERILNCSLHT